MAHWYSAIFDPGTSEKVLGSNPVVCMSNSCWPFESLYRSGLMLCFKRTKLNQNLLKLMMVQGRFFDWFLRTVIPGQNRLFNLL